MTSPAESVAEVAQPPSDGGPTRLSDENAQNCIVSTAEALLSLSSSCKEKTGAECLDTSNAVAGSEDVFVSQENEDCSVECSSQSAVSLMSQVCCDALPEESSSVSDYRESEREPSEAALSASLNSSSKRASPIEASSSCLPPSNAEDVPCGASFVSNEEGCLELPSSKSATPLFSTASRVFLRVGRTLSSGGLAAAEEAAEAVSAAARAVSEQLPGGAGRGVLSRQTESCCIRCREFEHEVAALR